MINNVTTKYGESFLGVAAYVLHDKRTKEQLAVANHSTGIDTTGQTSHRVAWTATRNLATNDAETAARVMTFYAMERENIKRANGVKSTGRKAKGPVCHISFSWHPEQSSEITSDQMKQFAYGALRELGFQHQQAIIVCHNDEPQPHVHLIVSRVDPKTGRMVNCQYDRNKLSRYANKYVKSIGKDYCPMRDENEKRRREQKKKRQEARIVVRDDSLPKNLHRLKTAAVNDNAAREELLRQQRESAAIIFAFRDQIRSQQNIEWQEFEAKQSKANVDLKTSQTVAIRRAMKIYHDHYREAFRDLKRRHTKEQQRFAEDEKKAFGKVRNLFRMDHRTLFQEYELRRKHNRGGLLGAVFKVMGDAGIRLQVFEASQQAEIEKFDQSKRSHEAKIIRDIKQETANRRTSQRDRFVREREALIAKHDRQDEEIKTRWQEHTKNFATAWKKIVVPGRRRKWEPGDLTQERARQMAAELVEARSRRRERGR